MSSERQAPPRAGEVWQKNDSGRRVRIEDTGERWAEVRNVETGRSSRIDLYVFTRRGTTGWTRVSEPIQQPSKES